jgi:hypothetical protein
MAKPYHRRSGVIRRSGLLGSRPGSALTGSPNVIDSGEDAPLSNRGRLIFRGVLFLIAAFGLVLVFLSR